MSAVAGDKHKVHCNVCHSEFTCDRGEREVKRHGTGLRHQDNLRKASSVSGEKWPENTIVSALKKAENKAVEKQKVKDYALIAEACISSLIATHNAPLPLIDCLAELLPKIIHDSEIIKQMSLHRTKAVYTLKFGLADHEKKKILKQLRLW